MENGLCFQGLPNRKEKEQGEEDADGSMLLLSSIFSGLPRSSTADTFSLSLNMTGMHSVCIERCEEVYTEIGPENPLPGLDSSQMNIYDPVLIQEAIESGVLASGLVLLLIY